MAAAMPSIVASMMAVPTDFGRQLPGAVLRHGRGSGIDQRQRLRALGRSHHRQNRDKHRKAQNFRSVHLYLLEFSDFDVCAVWLLSF
jgi:hypothetical protein